MPGMAVRNFLVEGVSATGKTSVCTELRRRGYRAVHGDRELAYQGDPGTGAPTETSSHEHHLWDVARVRALAADRDDEVVYVCGGSRNFSAFLDVFHGVFVLQVDRETLEQRVRARPEDEFGAAPEERELVLRLHATGQDVPDGIGIDATAPLDEVVDEILRRSRPSWPVAASSPARGRPRG